VSGAGDLSLPFYPRRGSLPPSWQIFLTDLVQAEFRLAQTISPGASSETVFARFKHKIAGNFSSGVIHLTWKNIIYNNIKI
jgi:hypothetical protein